jgi:predicted lipoprotein with Yx(FWY)xxD motif
MKLVRNRLSQAALFAWVVLLAVAACSPAATPAPPTAAPTAAAQSTGPAVVEASLQTAKNAALGTFLADADGRTVYLFTKDSPLSTTCYDKCAQSWPPLLTLGQPKLNAGVNSALVGTTRRTDGTSQLTYNGWPLYYYAKDKAAGDTVGQAVGGVWWVVSAEGNPIKPASLAVTQTADLGSFLVDNNGNTLYLYTKDATNSTVCYDKCEQYWPPLLTLDKPKLGPGVDASLLGTTQRQDGTTQVTYNGWPLYYYAKDAGPGDTTGQGVDQVWYVITPDGKEVKK